jgi:hypothetical protein
MEANGHALFPARIDQIDRSVVLLFSRWWSDSKARPPLFVPRRVYRVFPVFPHFCRSFPSTGWRMETASSGRSPLDAPGTPSFSFDASQAISSTPRRRPSDDFLHDSDTESIPAEHAPRSALSRKKDAMRRDLLDVDAPPSTSSSTLVDDFSPPGGDSNKGKGKTRGRAGESTEEETATPAARRQHGALGLVTPRGHVDRDFGAFDQLAAFLCRLF